MKRTIESRALVRVATRPERSIGWTIGLLLVKPYATFFTVLVAACKPNAEAQQKLLARMMINFMVGYWDGRVVSGSIVNGDRCFEGWLKPPIFGKTAQKKPKDMIVNGQKKVATLATGADVIPRHQDTS